MWHRLVADRLRKSLVVGAAVATFPQEQSLNISQELASEAATGLYDDDGVPATV